MIKTITIICAVAVPLSAHAETSLQSRVKAFWHAGRYEGRGEWNCAPRVCERNLKRYRLTWREVIDVSKQRDF